VFDLEMTTIFNNISGNETRDHGYKREAQQKGRKAT